MDERRPQDVVAAGYDQMASRFAEWQTRIVGDPRERYIERLLARLPPDPEILEIGSGGGVEPTPTLAKLGHLIGVDISRAQIERAGAKVPNAQFIHADILETRFDDESFDAVVALFVLTHIPTAELPSLLHRISAWLRPGGTFLATLSGAAAQHDDIEDDWLGVPMFFGGFDPTSNQALVELAAMRVLESRVEPVQEPEGEVRFHWLLAEKPT
jgi:cyclopropane fatty-acyl-phospholipid synthase-like methyltransferase